MTNFTCSKVNTFFNNTKFEYVLIYFSPLAFDTYRP